MQRKVPRRSDPDAHMERLGYLTIHAAAARARRSVHTIYRWIDDGSLKTLSSGKRKYVTKDSLQAVLGPLYSVLPNAATG